MIGLSRIGAAADHGITLEDAKSHLQVDSGDSDALIAGYLAAAAGMVAEATGLVLGLETWQFSGVPQTGILGLPKTPVRDLTAIDYVAADGSEQSANVADFRIVADDARPYMLPVTGKAWPVLASRPDAVTVTFTAGLTAVPPELRVAMLMLVGHWFAHREAVTELGGKEVPMAAQALIDLYRTTWVAA